jgi:hypothetical protein
MNPIDGVEADDRCEIEAMNCWRHVNRKKPPLRQLSPYNRESTTGEKTSFTALGDISCAGEKLPLWVLAKGRTGHCERKSGPHRKVILQHSESGWATENGIIECIT